MNFLALFIVVVTAVVPVLSQLIELGYPTNGANLPAGEDVTVQVVQPVSLNKHLRRHSVLIRFTS